MPPPKRSEYKDLFFDQWLTARGERLRALVSMAQKMLDHAEEYYKLRKRKRRKADLKNHRAMVETIISNLAFAVVTTPDHMTIATPLTKRNRLTRYDRPIFRQLRPTLDALAQAGFLKLTVSWENGRASTIAPDPWFIKKVKKARIDLEDFGRHESEEVIILTSAKWDFKTNSKTLETTFGKQRKRIDYKNDTTTTRRYRREVQRINECLAGADLELVSKTSDIMSTDHVDTSRRNLKRHFSLPPECSAERPRFNLGGRLFGGWWQILEKTERHRIRIDGERIVDLDFAALYPRLAYLKVGHEPPEGDPYSTVTGLKGYRNGVKAMMNTLLSASDLKVRIPPDIKSDLPKSWTARKVRTAVLDAHPYLEAVFEKGIGMELMFTESQILIAALLRLIDLGIVALPMHDGLMVSVSKAADAKAVMENTALELTGYKLPVVRADIKA